MTRTYFTHTALNGTVHPSYYLKTKVSIQLHFQPIIQQSELTLFKKLTCNQGNHYKKYG